MSRFGSRNDRSEPADDPLREVGRQSTRVQQRRDAKRCGCRSDVLLAEGIDTTINAARDGQTVVWVRDDLHLERARALLQEFQSQPDAPRFTIAPDPAPLAPNRLRWGAPAMPDAPVDLIDSMVTMLVNRDPADLGAVPASSWEVRSSATSRPPLSMPMRWHRASASSR